MTWFENFVHTRLPDIAFTVLFIAVTAVVTLVVARIIGRALRRITDRQKQAGNTGSATILAFCRYLAVVAVYFAGFAVIVSNIPALSAGMNKLMAAAVCSLWLAASPSQEALGSMVSGLMILAFKPFVIRRRGALRGQQHHGSC